MIPIIFVNYGNCAHLPIALLQAKRASPASPVYLLSDTAPPKEFSFINYIDISKYQHVLDEVRHFYRHLCSGADETFEYFCIARWFVISEFVKSAQIKFFLHLDSDVLLFSDAQEIHQPFAFYDFTLSRYACGHNSFWNSMARLDEFCAFVRSFYFKQNQWLYEKIEEMVYHPKENYVHISDMTFLGFFAELQGARVCRDTAEVRNGCALDNNLFGPNEPYETHENLMRKIEWINAKPHGYLKDTRELVRFHTLHFQGANKHFMAEFFKRCGEEIAKG